VSAGELIHSSSIIDSRLCRGGNGNLPEEYLLVGPTIYPNVDPVVVPAVEERVDGEETAAGDSGAAGT
jgi:hypothetical protein